ncbi:DNA topoisomerase I [Candidatus Micrarchaeota archaeon]|nr:DNA topoisomerase I [Candidatus Micrarchaeota archaeon]
MDLIVAEKPRVAEKIANAIGESVKKKSYKGVYYYEAKRNGQEFMVAPAVGHVYTLVEKEKTRGYPIFDIEWVPAYEASKEAAYTKGYVELIQKLGKSADTFVSACDYDIEGSTIAYNVFRFATTIRQGQRMKFSALTQGDLEAAYDDRAEFDYSNAYAGEARHIIDWYYGINLSRALMGALRAAHRYKVMSVGRVQGPALSLLSNLESSIRAFVPTPYWELITQIKEVEFKHKKDRFLDYESSSVSLENTKTTGKVSKVDKKEQKIAPNPNFDLTSLQVEAYKLFKFSPSRTLELSQHLYEASLITYPRTSSNKIPPSIKLDPILSALEKNKDYSALIKKIKANKWTKPIQGKKDDPAHPAIHPTGQAPGSIEPHQKNLYDLIVKRFLASFAPSAKRARNRVEVESGGEEYAASGSRIVEPGWTEFYGKYYTTEDVELPEFKEGESVKLSKVEKTKKETKPPKRFTQASIVSELEKRHLGTKATRSVVVDTLFKRGYAEGKSIEVSDFGLKVSDVLQKYAPEILDENLTRSLEEKMELIQAGKLDKEEVISESRELLTGILNKWKKNEAEIGASLLDALQTTMEQESLVGPCDKCDKKLRIIRMKFKKQFIGCHGYPNCRNTYPLPTGAYVKPTGKECTACSKPTINVKKGRIRYTMCIDPNCPSKADWRKKSGSRNEKDSKS